MHYRTVQTCFWSDPAIHVLPPDSKLVALYLVTNPHSHVSGIYYLPFATMALDTGLKEYRIKAILDTLSHVKVDAARMVIWVEKMLHYQARGKKAYQAAANQLNNLHNSPLIHDFLIGYPIVKRYCMKSLLDRVSVVGPLKEEEEERKPTPTLFLNSSSEGSGRKQKRRKKPEILIPEEWTPKEFHQKTASALGLQLNMEATLFKGKAQEKQWVTADWDLKFKNWLVQGAQFRDERKSR